MESFFKTAATDVDNLQQEYLGPNYKYFKGIKSPGEMKMSGKGTMRQLGTNVGGIMNYVKILVEGGGAASKTGKPLGNKFFLPTGGKCKTKSGKEVVRNVYVNNVPTGQIPFVSDGLGVDMSMFKGMLPGVLEDVGGLNPLPLFGAFMQGASPPCTKITMETIDVDNRSSKGSGYVANAEIRAMPSVWFSGSKPTLEGFLNANKAMNGDVSEARIKLKKGIIPNLFRTSVGFLMLYLIFKLTYKKV